MKREKFEKKKKLICISLLLSKISSNNMNLGENVEYNIFLLL